MRMNAEEMNQAYCRGLNAALLLCKKGGAEAIEEEIKFRNVHKFSLPLSKNEMLKAAEVTIDEFQKNTIKNIEAMSLLVLMDEFDFKKEDLERFIDRYLLKTECLMTDELVNWSTYEGIIREEAGIDIELPMAKEEVEKEMIKKKLSKKSFDESTKNLHEIAKLNKQIFGAIANRKSKKKEVEKFADLIVEEILKIKGIGAKKGEEIKKAIIKAAG